MEPAGDSSLEAAIAWLVQTILATLLMDKMEAWIQQVGLADDVERLQSEVERVDTVVAAVKGRAAGNMPLSRSLARVKELLYDADDVIDELDYYRLQHQVEGVTSDEPDGMRGAERVDEISRGHVDTLNVSVGKLRSPVWEHFTITETTIDGKRSKAKCKYCGNDFNCETKTNGTSSMKKHLEKEHSVTCTNKSAVHPPNTSSTGDATCNVRSVEVGSSSNGKRKRTNEDPTQTTAANIHAQWDKAELSNRIIKITEKLQLQDIQGALSKVLEPYGSSATSSSNHHRLSTASDQHPTTSSLVPMEVYGRVAEKNKIKKSITENQSGGVNVLPIVGIAGVGKTTLAQFVYNDPDVKSQFHHRIWVCVSCKFDEVKLTKEMLDFFPRERHEGINNFAKLQEILKEHVEYQAKSFLLILDDVSDSMDYHKWNKLLNPLLSSQAKNIILVTTRNLSVAQRLSTLEPIKLGALENDDMWLLLKSCAFGFGNYEGTENLSTIGRQIAEKLKGNPLAAVTAGALLRDNLSIDHWSNILKNEKWKSLGLSGGIMPALKLSYDELTYRLQQCFSYCSIFPDKYRFLGKDLVYIWISQGFVNCTQNKRLEETGWEYLNQLVNLGFFQQIEEQQELDGEEEFSLRRQIWYSMCDLMHDFARMISRTECATIDGLQCNKIFPTVQHLSIVTGSAYNKDLKGNIPRNEKFEENMRNSVTSVTKLRTLVVLGNFDSFFVRLFQDIFQKAQNLRLLLVSLASTYLSQVPAAFNDFNSFLCNLANPLHLRYLKLELDGIVPQVLSTFFHLQVLDVGSSMDTSLPNGLLHNLVSLRHLVAHKRVHSSITSIGNMTSIQELHDFEVRISSGFEITRLQSMNELVQLGLSQLDSVKTREDAYGAGLRNKEHLEELHLSWKDAYSEYEYASDTEFESSANMAREVIEGLEPHMDLKHLQISQYNGTTSPAWLANNISVTSLQTLHLDDCGGWRILPSLGSLPFLTKVKLSSMLEVIEVLIPSLEELVLIKMPKLVRCSSTSAEGLSSSLRVLHIEDCEALKEFDLFENDYNSEIIQGSWLPGLRNLILYCCPHLKVLKPLPPSTTFSKVLIREISRFPSMEVSSGEKLQIGNIDVYIGDDFDESSDELSILDDKTLAFHNLRNLKSMEIYGCRNLRSFSFEGFSHLVSLTSLKIVSCEQLFPSDVTAEYTLEDVTAVNCNAFPYLKSLSIDSCGIAGKWLSLMLQHAPGLEELSLTSCAHITRVVLPMEEEENNLLTTVLSSGNQDEALTWLVRDGLLHIPSNLVSSLKNMSITQCPRLKFNSGKDCFSGFTSLEKLEIWGSLVDDDGSDDLENGSSFVFGEEDQPLGANGRWLLPTSLQELHIVSLYCQETLQVCFPRDITSLKKLSVRSGQGLQSLQLYSCTALEELAISGSGSVTVTVLEGTQPAGSLGRLNVSDCPGLPSRLDSFPRLCPRLERLDINDPSVLTTPFCKHLTSLQRLKLGFLKVTRLTDEQERALVLLKSLKELEIFYCTHLIDLPAGLQTLPSLKSLKIEEGRGISRLPEAGLPHSLEELEIKICSKLEDECRRLATCEGKLKVKIDGRYVN
uniref:Yellow rust resistance protein 7 n=1 Tax=Triticum aestivum TaxID=4565 RepID=A0A5K1KE61_WHEAT|nr:yellow rust resistance protein 7 [Triticum aestivum]